MWGGASANYLSQLFLLQKRVVQIIYGQPFLAHTNQLLDDRMILKMIELHRFMIALYMHKNKNDFFVSWSDW